MAVNQAALETREPRLRTPRIASLGLYHLACLGIVWIELWAFLVLGLVHSRIWFLGPLLLFKIHGYRHELSRNLADTIRHGITYSWQIHALFTWQHPRLTGVHPTNPTGLKEWAKRSIQQRRPVVPYERLELHIRRRHSQGNDKWLETFADYVKRQYRYADADATVDPDDPNQDVIVLTSRAIPNRVEAQ